MLYLQGFLLLAIEIFRINVKFGSSKKRINVIFFFQPGFLLDPKFILSLLLRETMNKMFIYGTTLVMVLFIERSLNEDWYIATRVVCAIASACELWSICANILIIKPNFPFVKLFRKYLVGEIAKKVGISEEEFTNEVKNKS